MRFVPIQRDSARAHRREDVSIESGVAGLERRSRREQDRPSGRNSSVEVETDQLGDVLRSWMRAHVADAPRLGHPARFDHDQAIGEGRGVDRIVRDHDPDPRELREVPAELAADLDARARVERGEWFIEKEKARVGREGASERDTLRLTAREREWLGARVLAEPHPFEPAVGELSRLAAGNTTIAQPERDVVPGAEVGEEQVVLEDDADRAVLGYDVRVRSGLVENDVVETYRAAVEAQQAGEDPQDRGLPRAVGAEDRDDLVVPGLQVDVEVEGADLDAQLRLEAHATDEGNQRSRSITRTTIEMAMSTRLSAIALSGLDSSWR